MEGDERVRQTDRAAATATRGVRGLHPHPRVIISRAHSFSSVPVLDIKVTYTACTGFM